LDLSVALREDQSICRFFEAFVVPFFVAFGRYEMGKDAFPLGERSHGLMGRLEALRDYLGLLDCQTTRSILPEIAGLYQCAGNRVGFCDTPRLLEHRACSEAIDRGKADSIVVKEALDYLLAEFAILHFSRKTF
jgi:hypothetical protein